MDSTSDPSRPIESSVSEAALHVASLTAKTPDVLSETSIHWSVLLTGMQRLYEHAACRRPVRIALIDGLVQGAHPTFAGAHIEIRPISGLNSATREPDEHATFIASMFVGQREGALALTPAAELINIPVVDEAFRSGQLTPREAAGRLSEGIARAVNSRADVIQLSFEFSKHVEAHFRGTGNALSVAGRSGARTVISAGNRPSFETHQLYLLPDVVPVVATDHWARPRAASPSTVAIGSRGLCAPGVDLPGATVSGFTHRSGSSLAASFVTSAFALLYGLFVNRTRQDVWNALMSPEDFRMRECAQFPPMIDVERAATRLARRML